MKELQKIEEELKRIVAESWVEQGHRLTGAFEKSLLTESEISGEDYIIKLYDTTESGYGKIVNEGITADKIPYSPGSGAKTSKYIDGLFSYVKARMGLSDKEALKVAFAIARTQKKEGMSTINSRKYSKTGKRQNFVEEAEDKINKMVEEILSKTLEIAI